MEREQPELKLPSSQWINWASSIVVAAIGATVFLFSTFVMKSTFDSHKQDEVDMGQMIIKRIDRLESKIDFEFRRTLFDSRSRH